MTKKRIAVIGAGISGLTCAYELRRAGHEVVVFERDAQVGGRMSSRVKDHYIFDLGADHLCDLYDDMQAYCKEFGIEWEKMRFLGYRVWKQGALRKMGEAMGPVSKFRLAIHSLLMSNKIGNFLDLNELAKYDTDNAYDFMLRRCGREIADYFVDPFTSTYQFHRAKEISVGALYGIMKSLQRDMPRWDLHRTVGGMQALPSAFASRLDMRLNMSVSSVKAENGGVTVDGERFDIAVLASTANATKQVYANPTVEQKAILDETKYAATVSIAFRVDRSKLPDDVAVVWVPFVENQAISGYVNEAMKGKEAAHDAESLFCVWLHEEFARSIMDKSEAEIFNLAKAEVIKVCPWFTKVEDLRDHDLQRWPHAMPKFAHGHLKAVQTFLNEGQGKQNVFFCGDYLNAPWTEGALRLGKRVAAQINRGA